MKKISLLSLVLTIFIISGCNQKDQAGATGSGAGIQDERHENQREQQDATGADDMNITTPIDERPDVDE